MKDIARKDNMQTFILIGGIFLIVAWLVGLQWALGFLALCFVIFVSSLFAD